MVATHTFEPYTYECPLDMYMEVYWSRFPQHKYFPYILDSEIIERKQLEDGTELVVRKTKLDIDAPGWFKTLFGMHYSIFIEQAIIDKKNGKVTITTTNESLSSKAKSIDTTVYSVHPENPNWCTFTQTGSCELLVSVLGFQKKIEKYCINLYVSRYNESRELDKKMIKEYREAHNLDENNKPIGTATNTTTTTTTNTTTTDNVNNTNILISNNSESTTPNTVDQSMVVENITTTSIPTEQLAMS